MKKIFGVRGPSLDEGKYIMLLSFHADAMSRFRGRPGASSPSDAILYGTLKFLGYNVKYVDCDVPQTDMDRLVEDYVEAYRDSEKGDEEE